MKKNNSKLLCCLVGLDLVLYHWCSLFPVNLHSGLFFLEQSHKHSHLLRWTHNAPQCPGLTLRATDLCDKPSHTQRCYSQLCLLLSGGACCFLHWPYAQNFSSANKYCVLFCPVTCLFGYSAVINITKMQVFKLRHKAIRLHTLSEVPLLCSIYKQCIIS